MEPQDTKDLERIDLPIQECRVRVVRQRLKKGCPCRGSFKATVNFAAEKATVVFHPSKTAVSHLIEKVKDLGYGAGV